MSTTAVDIEATQRDDMLTPEELAALLRTSVAALAMRRYRGGGPPFVKVGRSVLYPRAEVERFVRKQLRSSTAA